MPLGYPAAHLIHTACVTASLLWFALRAILMLRGDPRLLQPLHDRGPHYLDTLLLASGAYLAVLLHQVPLESAWLTAKLTALLVYIVCGAIALKRGRTRRIRTVALIAAGCAAAYMISVALTKDPSPWR